MNLSPVMVKNKTFWTPVDNVKVTLSLLLERISTKYESFECFLPGVGYYFTFGKTLQLITLTAVYSTCDQNQLNLIQARNVASFDVMFFPILKILATFDWLNGQLHPVIWPSNTREQVFFYARGFNQSKVVIIFKPEIIIHIYFNKHLSICVIRFVIRSEKMH